MGALRDRDISWGGKIGFEWTNNFDILGISYNTHDMGNMTQLYINNKIGEIKKNLLTSGTPEILPSSPLGYNDYLKL